LIDLNMLYLMYETSVGVALFKKKHFDELATDLAQIQKDIVQMGDFSKMVKLEAFKPFTNHEMATETLRSLAAGELSPFMTDFLETYFPMGKSKAFLAFQDNRLAQSANSEMGITCKNNDAISELYRGIRYHFDSYLKQNEGTEGIELSQACLGLGHAVARLSLQFDVNRQDKGVINSYCLIEQMEKNLNTFAMRVKEWYGWHFPELARLIPDNEVYVKLVNYIGNRDNLSDENLVEMEEISGSGELSQKVLDMSMISMGNDLTEVDEASLKSFSQYVCDHYDYKNNLQGYLKEKMEIVSPNLTALLNESVGAKLVNASGSLANLAKLPASTIQIMGAEKALFRALKKKGSTPKYGLLYNSSFISRAGIKDKGKISRFLANKCALAARLDQHLINPTNRFGIAMKKQVDDRLESLAKGTRTEKNQDVIEEVLAELKAENLYVECEMKKKKSKKEKKVSKDKKKDKKKKKKRSASEMDVEATEEAAGVEDAMEEEALVKPKKKKKKSKPE